MAHIYINNSKQTPPVRILTETLNPNIKIKHEDIMKILIRVLKKDVFNQLNKNLPIDEDNMINTEDLIALGFKIIESKKLNKINLLIPENNLKKKEIEIKTSSATSETALRKKIVTKGKYSNYTNITIKTNSNTLDNTVSKNNTIAFQGLCNIDNLKLRYSIKNTEENTKLQGETLALIWEEFNSFNIEIGYIKKNLSFANNINNTIATGIEIRSKKQPQNNLIDKTISVDQDSNLKLFINKKQIANLYVTKGSTRLTNIPLTSGLNKLIIKSFDKDGNLLWEKKSYEFKNKNSHFKWIGIENYSFFLNSTNQTNTSLIGLTSMFNLNTPYTPIMIYNKIYEDKTNELNYKFNLYENTTFKSIHINKKNLKVNSISLSSNYLFDKKTPFVNSISIGSSFNNSNNLDTASNTKTSALTSTLSLKKYKEFNQSISYSQSIRNETTNKKSMSLFYTINKAGKKRETFSYSNNLGIALNKEPSEALSLSLTLLNEVKIKQKNITYSLSLNNNKLKANINLFWYFSKETKLETTISTKEIHNNFIHKDTKNNFRFNANAQIASLINLNAGFRHNDKNINTSGTFRQTLGNSDRQDTLSLFTPVGSIFYDFNNTEDNHNSSLTLTTAIGFADGHFAVTDKINNSFLIVKQDKKIKNTSLIVNNQAFSLFNTHIITNLQKEKINNISIELKTPESLLFLEKTNYDIPIKENKGEVLIINTQGTNLAIITLKDTNKQPLRYKYITYYEKNKPENKIDILSSKTGKIQLVGIKKNTTYIIDSNIQKLKPIELFIPRNVKGIYKVPELIFKEKK
ncbi:MAG: hypothetical protein VW378_03685 [bacterium]